jgi:hypothetical protein
MLLFIFSVPPVHIVKELKNLVQFNLLEFDQGWNQYHIEATPTIVHFKNGVEEARIVEENTRETFKDWFKAAHKIEKPAGCRRIFIL